MGGYSPQPHPVLFFYKSLYGKIRLDKDLEVIIIHEDI